MFFFWKLESADSQVWHLGRVICVHKEMECKRNRLTTNPAAVHRWHRLQMKMMHLQFTVTTVELQVLWSFARPINTVYVLLAVMSSIWTVLSLWRLWSHRVPRAQSARSLTHTSIMLIWSTLNWARQQPAKSILKLVLVDTLGCFPFWVYMWWLFCYLWTFNKLQMDQGIKHLFNVTLLHYIEGIWGKP